MNIKIDSACTDCIISLLSCYFYGRFNLPWTAMFYCYLSRFYRPFLVTVAPTNISISPDIRAMSAVTVGQVVTCSALAKPPPLFYWHVDRDMYRGAVLRITNAMIGKRRLQCVAANMIQSQIVTSSSDVLFVEIRSTNAPLPGYLHT